MHGWRFGRLKVLGVHSSTKQGLQWACQCDCGAQVVAAGKNLRNGHTRSCGCLVRETAAGVNLQHGKSNAPEYKAWSGMWNRCTNPSYYLYESYGGRGIAVCERWKSFAAFYEDIGPRPTSGHSLDRIDVNGNYEPSNCRWATAKQQQRNKRSNVLATLDGITAPVAEHCERLGVGQNTAYCRLRKGLPPEIAVDPRPLRVIRKELENKE